MEQEFGDYENTSSPEKFDLESTGWRTFSEYLLDISGLIPRPSIPRLPGRPMRYEGTSYLRGKPANAVEEEVVRLLEVRNKSPESIEHFSKFSSREKCFRTNWPR